MQVEGDINYLLYSILPYFDFLTALLEYLDLVDAREWRDFNHLSTHQLLTDAQLMHLAWQLSDTVPRTTLIVHSRNQ